MYRIAFVAGMLTLVLGACSDEEVTELSMTVQTNGTFAAIAFREVAHPECSCSAGNVPEPGGCVVNSDAISCSCDYEQLASCVERVSSRKDGVVQDSIEPTAFLWVRQVHINVDGADELLVEGCGGTASIPLPRGDYPTATITDAARVDDEHVRLRWTTRPEASYVVTSIGLGPGDRTCMEDNVGWQDFYAPASRSVSPIYVTPVGLDEHDTGLGVAKVRYGVAGEHAYCREDAECPAESTCSDAGVCQPPASDPMLR